ncbi:hypothetical protein BER2_2120 [plant metagenome]|uniref:Uncharacterized protein n=1 Tax=plant metagenome TaxID=1297885 RepID=A0A484PFX5_9ZZZZ
MWLSTYRTSPCRTRITACKATTTTAPPLSDCGLAEPRTR